MFIFEHAGVDRGRAEKVQLDGSAIATFVPFLPQQGYTRTLASLWTIGLQLETFLQTSTQLTDYYKEPSLPCFRASERCSSGTSMRKAITRVNISPIACSASPDMLRRAIAGAAGRRTAVRIAVLVSIEACAWVSAITECAKGFMSQNGHHADAQEGIVCSEGYRVQKHAALAPPIHRVVYLMQCT